MMKRIACVHFTQPFALLLALFSFSTIHAQTTSFTYQGKLTDTGGAANGTYDFQFTLFDALAGGAQVGATNARSNVAVSNGVFSVTLDFGAAAFPGANRFLEIGVRLTGGGAFTTLSPRQPITSTPYAIQSLNAATAATAANFSGSLSGDVTGAQSATVLANNAVTTGKLADASVTNAKIADVAGGKITGSITTATIPGANVTGAVANATTATNATNAVNATNANNATNATNAATAINFSGALGGDVTGLQGATTVGKLQNLPLPAPMLADNGKVLRYKNDGVNPASFELAAVNVGGGTITGVTAGTGLSGGGASGNVTLNLANSGVNTAQLADGGVTDAKIASVSGSKVTGAIPVASVPAGSASYIQNSAAQQAASNFNISGNGTVGGTLTGNIVNAAAQYNLAGNRVLSVSGVAVAGFDNANTFAGVGAGASNAPSINNGDGLVNSFFGFQAGFGNTAGSQNDFFGFQAGLSNTTGSDNSFFGALAGQSNTTGGNNSFFGAFAGEANTTSSDNSFFGASAGTSNSTGISNSFFGSFAGAFNTMGKRNVAIGYRADFRNSAATSSGAVSGDENLFVGYQAGGASARRNAAAIGTNAFVGCDDCMVLGSSAVAAYKVGIGTDTPFDKLHIAGELRVNSCVKNVFGTQIAGTCSSDLRLKRDITPFPQLLDKVAKLRPVHFYWRSGEFPQYHFGTEQAYGLIAQEVEAVLPELVSTDAQGFKAVNYSKLPLLTLQAVKELKTENDALRQQNTTLEARLAALEQIVLQFKKQTEQQPRQQ